MARTPSNPDLKFYWLHAQPENHPFYRTKLSGKWCFYVPPEAVDAAWARIDALVACGKLRAATVSTHWNHQELGGECYALFVFTDDWTRRQEVQRVRRLLFADGFTRSIGYQRDIDAGRPLPGAPEFIYTDADMLS